MAPVVGLIIPTSLETVPVNQMLPSGPAVIPDRLMAAGFELGDVWAGRVDLADRAVASVNQRLPSGPAVIPSGAVEHPPGDVNSLMAWVVGLISPIWSARPSVNQRLPSGPAVICLGAGMAVGMANELMAWVVGLIIPISLAS